MPVTLTIIADSAAELVQEFRALNAETTPSVSGLDQEPLDALIERVRQRLREDGFKLEIIDQRDQNPPDNPPVQEAPPPQAAPTEKPVVEEAPRPKGKGKKAAPAVQAPADDLDALMGPAIKSAVTINGVDVEEEPSDALTDRQYVLDTLATMMRDGKIKPRVLAFAAEQAKLHGSITEKISDLGPEPYPAIRTAMKKEFPNAPKPAS